MGISMGSILSEGLVAAGIAAGMAYWLKTPTAKEARAEAASLITYLGIAEVHARGKQDTAVLDVPVEQDPSLEQKGSEGVLGLMGDSRSEPREAVFSSARTASAPASLDSLVPKTSSAEGRRHEELMWAMNTVSDMGPVTCVVVDTDGDVLVSEGALLESAPSATGILKRVSHEEVLDVPDNEKCPYLRDTVRSIACFPVGERGAALMVASEEDRFFGDFELRTLRAMVGRLAYCIDAIPDDDVAVDALPADDVLVDAPVSVDAAATIEEAR